MGLIQSIGLALVVTLLMEGLVYFYARDLIKFGPGATFETKTNLVGFEKKRLLLNVVVVLALANYLREGVIASWQLAIAVAAIVLYVVVTFLMLRREDA